MRLKAEVLRLADGTRLRDTKHRRADLDSQVRGIFQMSFLKLILIFIIMMNYQCISEVIPFDMYI